MSKHSYLSKVLAALLAVSSLTTTFSIAHADPTQEISATERARRKAQSDRDKAANQQSSQQQSQQSSRSSSSNGSSSYGSNSSSNRSNGNSQQVDYQEQQRRAAQSARDKAANEARKQQSSQQSQQSSSSQKSDQQPTTYKYESAEARDAAKQARKAARDRGEVTTTSEVIHKKDGSATTVVNRSTPNGKTTTDVKKTNRNGTPTETKRVTTQYIPGTHVAEVNKRITDFSSRGNVKSITNERSVSFRNSSDYNTVVSRSTAYNDYASKYRDHYSSSEYRDRNFYGGFYYGFRPVVEVNMYFNNPVIFWLYNDYYSDDYYSTYWGSDYVRFDSFRHAGVFYPTQDLVDLGRDIAYMPFASVSGFRGSMSELAEQLSLKVPGRLGKNDIVMTHSQIVNSRYVTVEGYVNGYAGEPFGFKALLDLYSPSETLVFVPSNGDYYILDQINTLIGWSRAPSTVYVPSVQPSSSW